MAGTIVSDTLQDGSGNSTATTNAIQGSAKAWVRFAGATGTIAGSYNVSSVTRTSTGYYTVNFTNALANANYSVVGSVSTTAATGYAVLFMFTNASYTATAPTTSSFIMASVNSGAVYVDPVYVTATVFSS